MDVDPGMLTVRSARRSMAGVRDDMDALLGWAREHDISIDVARSRAISISGRSVSVPQIVRVTPIYNFDSNQWFRDYTCPFADCEGLVNAGMAVCSTCDRSLHCENCNTYFQPSQTLLPNGDTLGCRNCIRHCSRAGCTTVIPRTWRQCEEHGSHFHCADCDTQYDATVTTVVQVQGQSMCMVCAERYCGECNTRNDNPMRPLDGRMVCDDCWDKANAKKIENGELVSMTADQWMMPVLPDRPYRLVSIEQEFDSPTGTMEYNPYEVRSSRDPGVGNIVAKDLHLRGLAAWDVMSGYHSGNHDKPCHVEADSSVSSGGELILNRLRLDTLADAGHMAEIQNVVKKHVDEKAIRFTARCGTHIHVDMHGYTVPDARNLVTIYSYLEDVIFRLGSAGYGDHRSVISNSEFALPIKKDKWGDIKKFGVEFLRAADHTDSLNMQHFYNAMKFCKCGAIEFGNMAECECVRKKCTAEWRVFNGTGDQRKLHAYIALVQAVTAWCQNRELDMDAYPALDFMPTLDFTKEHTDMHRALIAEWVTRLRWMFENLPLTQSERESVLYCITKGPLMAIGWLELARLRDIERVEEAPRTLSAPMVSERGTQAPHGYERGPGGYCVHCGETRDYCHCGDSDFDEEDWS